jgi:hypothetical protein
LSANTIPSFHDTAEARQIPGNFSRETDMYIALTLEGLTLASLFGNHARLPLNDNQPPKIERLRIRNAPSLDRVSTGFPGLMASFSTRLDQDGIER